MLQETPVTVVGPLSVIRSGILPNETQPLPLLNAFSSVHHSIAIFVSSRPTQFTFVGTLLVRRHRRLYCVHSARHFRGWTL
jgi:hypothetical protein